MAGRIVFIKNGPDSFGLSVTNRDNVTSAAHLHRETLEKVVAAGQAALDAGKHEFVVDLQ